MSNKLKKPIEKLQTKIKNLVLNNPSLIHIRKKITFKSKILFSYNNLQIKYGLFRYYPTKIENLVTEDFEVTIPLTNENLTILSSNISNPPNGAKLIIDIFRKSELKSFNKIIIGSNINCIKEGVISITKGFYETIIKINKEEGKDKFVRFTSRIKPLFESNFNIQLNEVPIERDYQLLLKEIIASGKIAQEDIIEITKNLAIGNNVDIVIKQQITKQAEWLIEKIQEIIDKGRLSTLLAKDLGSEYFGFPKTSITGPEHLMEKILTKYGKYTLFGVPVLLNTDKYVTHSGALSRSQFDLILINHLSDIEVVELKRPDAIILEFDENRGKFYASKDLSIAVAQAERYISTVYHNNDDDFKINNQKIKDYLNSQIGGSMTVEICRPKALIILGSYLTIAADYNSLSAKTKNKMSSDDYNSNYLQSYKEIKDSFKNIHVLTYSELVENARTRLLTN